jgi:hypothetical protein
LETAVGNTGTFVFMSGFHGDGQDQSRPRQPSRLERAGDLHHARMILLSVAADADRAVLIRMLAEALTQIEAVGPALSGEAWEAYSAIERAAQQPGPG